MDLPQNVFAPKYFLLLSGFAFLCFKFQLFHTPCQRVQFCQHPNLRNRGQNNQVVFCPVTLRESYVLSSFYCCHKDLLAETEDFIVTVHLDFYNPIYASQRIFTNGDKKQLKNHFEVFYNKCISQVDKEVGLTIKMQEIVKQYRITINILVWGCNNLTAL